MTNKQRPAEAETRESPSAGEPGWILTKEAGPPDIPDGQEITGLMPVCVRWIHDTLIETFGYYHEIGDWYAYIGKEMQNVGHDVVAYQKELAPYIPTQSPNLPPETSVKGGEAEGEGDKA